MIEYIWTLFVHPHTPYLSFRRIPMLYRVKCPDEGISFDYKTEVPLTIGERIYSGKSVFQAGNIFALKIIGIDRVLHKQNGEITDSRLYAVVEPL